jgi:hypothetical protein
VAPSSARLGEYVIMGFAVFAALGYVLPWWTKRGSAIGRHRRLVRLCYGDATQAEMLIAAEMAQRPGLTREDAVSFVLAQLRRDRK